MNDNIIDRLEARSKELISKANDVIEARERLRGINERLESIPRLDDIIEAWDKYKHLMAGKWQRFGNSLLDGRFIESPELHKEGILLLSECRGLLLPYQELVSDISFDFDSIRDKLNDFIVGHRDIEDYLDILEAFFDEFDSRQYEIEALAPKDTSRQEEKKRSVKDKCKTIKDYILLQDDEQKDELLNTLHPLLDDKKGKMTALVTLVCMDMGLMEKPPHGALKQEFNIKGDKSGHNSYVAGGLKGYTKEEINGLKTRLEQFKIAINSQD